MHHRNDLTNKLTKYMYIYFLISVSFLSVQNPEFGVQKMHRQDVMWQKKISHRTLSSVPFHSIAAQPAFPRQMLSLDRS